MAFLLGSVLIFFSTCDHEDCCNVFETSGQEGSGAEVSGCASAEGAAARLDALLALYDRQQPPRAPLTAGVSVDMRHASVDERPSEMRLLADLYVEWQDTRLAWNKTEWGCDTAQTSAERLWLPDVWLLNGAGGGAGDEGDLPAKLQSDGTVTWVRRLEARAPVALQLASWPSDVQTCNFKFGSRRLSVDELLLTLNARKFATVSESGAWRVKSMTSALTSLEQGDDKRTLVVIQVSVERRASAQCAATGAVLLTAVLLLAAAAFLPPADRPALCACASFVTALWMISALSRLPGAASTPRSLWLMAAVATAGAAAAVTAGLTRRVARVRTHCPSALRSLLATVGRHCSLTPDQEEPSQGDSGTWAAAAKLLDYILTSALLITVLVIACIYIFS